MGWFNALHDQIFHSFWTYSGTVVLILAIGSSAFTAFRGLFTKE